MKFIVIDVETMGIPSPESGLIQLAGAIEIYGRERRTFNFRIRPFPQDEISDEALEVNGTSRKELQAYDEPEKAFAEFVGPLDEFVDRYDPSEKFHLVAYNAKFDADHLRAWFEKNGDQYFGSWFWHPPLDVMSLSAIVLTRWRPDMENFRLVTVAERLGLETSKAKVHDALYDVGLTREIFRVLMDRIGTS